MPTIDIKQTAPNAIRNDFWNDFLDAVSSELNNFKTQTEKKKNFLDTHGYTVVNDLIELAKSFGYAPNLSLQSDLSTVQRETSSIYYKIRNKATTNFYNYIFKLSKRNGKVFNAYQDYLKLIRAVDFTNTVAALNSVNDLTLPFNKLIANTGYDDYSTAIATLDALLLLYFDSSNAWFFDHPNLIVPTQNIIFEYDIDQLVQDDNGAFYSLLPNYFRFLEKAVLYGKKSTTIPHIGGLLNIITDEDIYYDTYDVGHTGYSVPALKLNSSVTPFYKSINLSPIITLDSAHSFDEGVSWLFDIDAVTGDPKTVDLLFQNIVIGSGKKSLYSKSYPNVNFNMILYFPFDEEYGTTTADDSTNGYVGTVMGNASRVQGVVGKAINYDGLSTQVRTAIPFVNGNKTFVFWVNPSATQNFADARILYQSGYIDFYYEGTLLKVKITGSTGNVNLSATVAAGVNSQIAIQLDSGNNLATLYVNGNLEDSANITSIGTLTGSGNLYVGSDGITNYFKGIIDELRIYSALISISELTYLYQNKIGSLQSLDNRLWTGAISFNEVYEDSKWKSVNSWAPGLTVNKEYLGISNGVLSSISGVLKYPPIEPGYTIINYQSATGDTQSKDDGLGNILFQYSQGVIDYETGIYSLNFYRDYEILNFGVPLYTSHSINYYILNLPILPSSLSFQYTIGGATYTAIDNGNGVITGIGITSGSINYAIGQLLINFSTSVDASTTVFLSFKYRLTLLPINNSLILATYKLNSVIDITEMGITDNENNMVAYATFPPMSFDSIRNHISGAFHIRKP